MRKSIVAFTFVCMIFSGSMLFGSDFVHSLNISFDSALEEAHDFYTSSGGIEHDVKGGLSLIYEGHSFTSETLAVGFGAEFMVSRELDIDSTDEPTFNFAPVYFSMQMHTYRFSDVAPYFGLQLGYNLLYDGNSDYADSDYDLTGGPYYGVSAGLSFNQVTRVELRWGVYEGTYDIGSGFDEIDVRHHEISLVAGLQF